jgi:hypothetical protein
MIVAVTEQPPETTTPVKGRQRTLFESLGVSSEKHKKPTNPEHEYGNKKIRKLLSGERLDEFAKEHTTLHEVSALVEYTRDLKRAAREDAGQLVDPILRGRGISRSGLRSGRPRGSRRVDQGKSHKRIFAAPVLRRDPTAQEKLEIVMKCEELIKHVGVERPEEFLPATKRALEKKYCYEFRTVLRWYEKRDQLKNFVAKAKLGKHGLRPCGVRGKNVYAKTSAGARVQKDDEKSIIARIPLYTVYERIKAWIREERVHGHEIRLHMISQKMLFEMEYERDKQLVLQQHGSPLFNEKVLEAVRRKLSWWRVISPSDKQRSYVSKRVLPNLGATTRLPNRLTDKQARFDYNKCKTTWQTMDFFVDMVARGTVEELTQFVAHAEKFAEARRDTKIVVIDQTALWLKLRGDERVVASLEENGHYQHLKSLKQIWKKAGREHQNRVASELLAVTKDYPTFRQEVAAHYTAAGDKYRITLVNISSVENWFNPAEKPKPMKKRGILIVPCSIHCRLEDICVEKGEWLRDWSHKCSDGTTKSYTKGTKVGNIMQGWRAVQESSPELLEQFAIWGQPRAWTDELISCWLTEFIEAEHGQAIVQLDCLGAQWSEPVLLEAWSRGLIWCPLAPDTTSYLQEPDTHEHSQLKSIIREVKAELHFQLEQETKNKQKNNDYVPRWGPHEVVYVASESLKRLKQRHKTVPLEGMIRNNHLVVRPNAKGELEITPDTEPYFYKIPPNRGIPPEAAIHRLEICKNRRE